MANLPANNDPKSGLIDPSFKEDVVRHSDLIEVASDYGKVRVRGSKGYMLCPFHDDHNPSLVLRSDKQTFRCWTCGESGDVIALAMKLWNWKFREAVSQLAKRAGIPQPSHTQGPTEATQRRRRLAKVSRHALKCFQEALDSQPDARAYCEERGINTESVSAFALGFAPPGGRFLLERNLGAYRPDLLELGLLQAKDQGEPFDFFRNRLMIPIRDEKGWLKGFAGRTLDSNQRQCKYLNSPDSELFTKRDLVFGLYEALQASPEPAQLIVVEGYVDVILMRQACFPNTVCLMGTAVSTAQIERLFKTTAHLVFMFDGDDPGKRAAVDAAEAVLPHLIPGREVTFAFLPNDSDPAELVYSRQGALVQEALDNAVSWLEVLLNSLGVSQGLTLGKRAEKLARLSQWLCSVVDPHYKSAAILEAAHLCSVPVEIICRIADATPQSR